MAFWDIVNNSVYVAQAIVAIYGVYCVVVCLTRVSQKKFKTEDEQDQFLDALGAEMSKGNFPKAAELCSGDQRAVCYLSELAILNRGLGVAKVRQLVLDRFQRDVLSDLEHRMTWINTVVKTEPMLGLLGTVLGMMQAFGKLAGNKDQVDPQILANDISFALITTAVGLTIAIPLIICMSSINVRIRRMEESVGAGLSRFFEMFRAALELYPAGQNVSR